ncbi:MAG: S8 family serine peptidase, partial [bacterium]|nr:S8 family serine peptidase [bacterium]
MTIKKLVLFSLLLAAGLGLAPKVEASWSELSPGLEASLTDVSKINPDSLIDVVIFLDFDNSVSQVKKSAALKSLRADKVKSVISNLKSVSVSGIDNLRSYLNRASAAPIREFWITPSLTARLTAEQINVVSDMESVRLITEDALLNYIEPVDIKAAASMATSNSVQLVDLGVTQLWSRGLTGAGRLVCSFDTGVESDHPALSSKWRGNHASLASSWYSPVTPNSPPTDKIGHGTHTMGIMIGSTPTDTFGVAPAAEWITGGVVDQGRSLAVTLADIVAAFQWALNPDGNINTTDDVPDVILNSWGIPKNMFTPCDSTFSAVIEAVEAAGIVTIFAAGNEGPNPMTIRSPADLAVTPTNTFSVGAVDNNRVVASFSSRGPSSCNPTDMKPEVMAPGVSIRSSYKGGGYSFMSGSSMAAPYVAGIVALIRQYDPEATVSQIKNALIASAIDLGPTGEDNDYGYGFVDASKVLDYLNAAGPSDFKIERITYPLTGIATIEGTSEVEILIRSSVPVNGELIGSISAEKLPGVSIQDAEATFSFAGGGLFAYSSQPFIIELSSALYNGQRLPFTLELGYPNEAAIEMIEFEIVAGIAPPGIMETHSTGALELTVSDFGQYGLGPESNYNTGGRGLRYREGSNLLYEAGLIVGTGVDQLSSSVRDSAGQFAVSDFRPATPLSTGSYGLDGGFHHTARMNAVNSTAISGLTILQETVNFDTYEDNRFVI